MPAKHIRAQWLLLVVILPLVGCGKPESISMAVVHFESLETPGPGSSVAERLKFGETATSIKFLQSIAVKYQDAFDEPDPHKITSQLFNRFKMVKESDDSEVYRLFVKSESRLMSHALLMVWLKELDVYFDKAVRSGSEGKIALLRNQKEDLTERLAEVAQQINLIQESQKQESGQHEVPASLIQEREQFQTQLDSIAQMIIETDTIRLQASVKPYELKILELPKSVSVSRIEAEEYAALRNKCPELPEVKFEISLD